MEGEGSSPALVLFYQLSCFAFSLLTHPCFDCELNNNSRKILLYLIAVAFYVFLLLKLLAHTQTFMSVQGVIPSRIHYFFKFNLDVNKEDFEFICDVYVKCKSGSKDQTV